MKFCRFCGKQLGDDEVCDCEESKKAAENAESQGEAGAGAVIDNEKDSVTLDVSGVVEKAKSHKDLLIKIGCGVKRLRSDLEEVCIFSLCKFSCELSRHSACGEISHQNLTHFISSYSFSVARSSSSILYRIL